jgi:hypothetical protein
MVQTCHSPLFGALHRQILCRPLHLDEEAQADHLEGAAHSGTSSHSQPWLTSHLTCASQRPVIHLPPLRRQLHYAPTSASTRSTLAMDITASIATPVPSVSLWHLHRTRHHRPGSAADITAPIIPAPPPSTFQPASHCWASSILREIPHCLLFSTPLYWHISCTDFK